MQNEAMANTSIYLEQNYLSTYYNLLEQFISDLQFMSLEVFSFLVGLAHEKMTFFWVLKKGANFG